jgi:hypothetical protein
VLLADRFGGSPLEYWRMPAIERGTLLEMLGVEGEVAHAYEGTDPGDEVIFADDEA